MNTTKKHKTILLFLCFLCLFVAQPSYSQFKHDNRDHARLPCLLCHRRENNSAQPTLPGKASHAPCTGCHAQQFSNPASEFCSICHTDAQSGKVKSFPPLRSFNVRFDHAKHSAADAACATCHRRNRSGAGLSIPTRLNAHVTEKLACANCHNVRAGLPRGRQVTAPLPLNHHAPGGASSCGTCHNGQRTFGGDDFSVCKRCHKGSAWHF